MIFLLTVNALCKLCFCETILAQINSDTEKKGDEIRMSNIFNAIQNSPLALYYWVLEQFLALAYDDTFKCY